MSLTVLAVAAAHAIPVIGSAIFAGRGGALVAALIMSVVAVMFGGNQYAFIDLLAIWLAWFFVGKA
jgi:hypothetical protein